MFGAAFGAPDVGGTPPCAASRTDVLTQIAGRATLLCESLAPLGSLQARDGSTLTWAGDAPAAAAPGAPRAITIRVSPVRPGHSVTLEHRAKGGLVTEQVARPELRPSAPGERVFKAILPAAPDGLVEFLPVLRFAGQPISPRLADAPGRPRSETTSRERETSSASARTRAPVWNWNARFLASLQATVLEQKVGKVPDGCHDRHPQPLSHVGLCADIHGPRHDGGRQRSGAPGGQRRPGQRRVRRRAL